MKIKRLLIIPARLGSKRIKNKNIKKFCGKPIINWSIMTAKKSKLFSKIHVSTESMKIKKSVEKQKIRVDFLRQKKLSNDFVGLIDVYKFVIDKYKKLNFFFDEVWFLTPCSPLVDYKDLRLSAKFFQKVDGNAFLAVSKFSPPIQWAMELKNKKLTFIKKKYSLMRSQDLKEYYFDTGTFGAFKNKVFDRRKIDNLKFHGYEISKTKGIDIDNLDDWNLAEKIATNN